MLAKKARLNELLLDPLVRDEWRDQGAFSKCLNEREIEYRSLPGDHAELLLLLVKKFLLKENREMAEKIYKRGEKIWGKNKETIALRDQADLLLLTTSRSDRPVEYAREAYLRPIQKTVFTNPKAATNYYKKAVVRGIWYVNADTETARLQAMEAMKQNPLLVLMTPRLENPLRMYWTDGWSAAAEEQADARSDLIRKLLLYFERNSPEIQQIIEKVLRDGLENGVWLANAQTKRAYATVLVLFEAHNYPNPIGELLQLPPLKPEAHAQLYCNLIKKKADASSGGAAEIFNSGIVNGIWILTPDTIRIRCEAVTELEQKKCKGQMHIEIESAFDALRKDMAQSSPEKLTASLCNVMRKILMRADRNSPEYQQMILRVIKEGFDRNLWHLNEGTEIIFMNTLLWLDAFDCLKLYKDPHPPLYPEAQAFICFCAIEDLLDRKLKDEASNLYDRAEFNGVWRATPETKKCRMDAWFHLTAAGCAVLIEPEEADEIQELSAVTVS
jgi:hypothetical protein